MSIGAVKDSQVISQVDSDAMNERHQQAVTLRLQGKTFEEIGTVLGVKKQRAQRMIEQALASGDYSVSVQVSDARGVPREDVAAYLRRALTLAGLVTHKADNE